MVSSVTDLFKSRKVTCICRMSITCQLPSYPKLLHTYVHSVSVESSAQITVQFVHSELTATGHTSISNSFDGSVCFYLLSLVFGRLLVKRFALCYRTIVCLSVLSGPSVCDVGVLWPNGWMDQNKTWHRDMPRPRPHCGPSSLPQKGHSPLPNFCPCLLFFLFVRLLIS